MSRLARLLKDALQGRSIQQAADQCGVPYWILRDVIYGSVKRPHARHLRAIAEGLGLEYDSLVLAAYEDDPAPRQEVPVT